MYHTENVELDNGVENARRHRLIFKIRFVQIVFRLSVGYYLYIIVVRSEPTRP